VAIDVGIVGAYSTKYELRSEKEAWDMLREVVEGVMKSVEKGIDGSDIDLVIVANFSDRFGGILHTAPLVASLAKARGAKGFRVENACASGGTAILLAWTLLRSGLARNALVVGFEKMSYQPTASEANEVLSLAAHPDEIVVGASFTSLYALIAKAYMDAYGAREEDLALVAVKNHENGLRNPLAAIRRGVTVEDVMKSPYISWPLKLLDCSPITDGAVAVILSSEPRKFTDTPVYIRGMALGHDLPGLFERPDVTSLIAIRNAAEEALKIAGVEAKDVDVFEVHDAFTIAEIVIYEMLGLARKGEGVKLIREGVTLFTGEKPVNPSGGLKSKGHPVGATGIGMAAELFWQLRGEAGERQVKGAELGLMENHGGTGSTAVVAVLSR
jgi:acetyl-CoA C-acetyltransferase